MEQDNKKVCAILKTRNEETQRQVQYNRISNLRYSEVYKYTASPSLPEYLYKKEDLARA